MKKPFYISFTHERIPQTVNHSKSNPGPPGETLRAGYTSFRQNARFVAVWDDGPISANGLIPIFARSFNIYFRLSDFLIEISSHYHVTSCAYQATLRHELEAHVFDPISIFHSYRNILIRRLNIIDVPTMESPLLVSPQLRATKQEEIEQLVVSVIGQTKREIANELRRASARHDRPSSYRLVYNQCSDAQWARGQ